MGREHLAVGSLRTACQSEVQRALLFAKAQSYHVSHSFGAKNSPPDHQLAVAQPKMLAEPLAQDTSRSRCNVAWRYARLANSRTVGEIGWHYSAQVSGLVQRCWLDYFPGIQTLSPDSDAHGSVEMPRRAVQSVRLSQFP